MSATSQSESQAATATHRPDTKKHGKRLTQTQIVRILTLADAGMNNSEIARDVRCDDSTVNDVRQRFGDQRLLARKVLESGAAKMAATVVNTKDSGTALKALGKLDVVREDAAGAGTSVLIAIGQPGGELPASLAPPAITVEAIAPSPSVSEGLHRVSVERDPSSVA